MLRSFQLGSGIYSAVCFVVVALLGSAITLAAQTSATAAPADQQKRAASPTVCVLPSISAERLQEVLDAIAKLPAPLASDAMIRVGSKLASQCPALAKDLLQRTFDQADSVEPATAYKVSTGIGHSTDSHLSFANKTYELAMDRLSLQSRAVMAMAPLDARKAIQLFRQISLPRPAAAVCSSGFAPDVSIYYDALAKVYALAKAQKPRNDAEAQAPFLQLQEVVSATTSPVQLAPLAKVLEAGNLSPAELSSLLSTLAACVENFPVDDNSFYYWKSYPSVKAKDQLVQLATRKRISAAAFLRSFYDYLDRGLNGVHCEGNEPKDVKELTILYRSFTRTPGVPEQGVEHLHTPDTAPPIEPGPDPGRVLANSQRKGIADGRQASEFR
jgi:hypothetical protein